MTITRLIKRERAKRDGVFEVYLDGELLLMTRRPLTDAPGLWWHVAMTPTC